MLMHKLYESFAESLEGERPAYGRVTVLVDGSWNDGLKVEIIYADNSKAIPMKVSVAAVEKGNEIIWHPGVLLDAPRAEHLAAAINHALGIAAAQQQKYFNVVIWK